MQQPPNNDYGYVPPGLLNGRGAAVQMDNTVTSPPPFVKKVPSLADFGFDTFAITSPAAAAADEDEQFEPPPVAAPTPCGGWFGTGGTSTPLSSGRGRSQREQLALRIVVSAQSYPAPSRERPVVSAQSYPAPSRERPVVSAQS
ncbi:hypothetical protein GPALN_011509 [Globodera pallida]|nr:hypothetical protein GPALN_011509 [Globodera pallida]